MHLVLSLCGDFICEAGESETCPLDCTEEIASEGVIIPDAALCGNAICEEGEDVVTCPSDCTGEIASEGVIIPDAGSNASEESASGIIIEPENTENAIPPGTENNASEEISKEDLGGIKETTFISSSLFKIIIIVIVLIIIGIIIYIFYNKRKSANTPQEPQVNQSPS